ncbi:MAG: hypothetical protein CES88_12305 [Halobacteriovorax sp. JY17]|nr:MAG: hypothetical protein CES88_12305 [Halobacteriovorax sp. JY17]
MEHSDKTYYVFIDNQAFKTIKYDLSHSVIETIVDGVEEGNIKILVNSILEGEFVKHCSNQLNSERQALDSLRCSVQYMGSELESIVEKIGLLSGEGIWKCFIDLVSATSIDKNVEWKVVFDKYFKGEAPFSSKKKDEFPDAFTIEMLSIYVEKGLFVISGDNDFFSWSESKDQVTAFRCLKDFTDFYVKEQKKYASIINTLVGSIGIVEPIINGKIEDQFSDGYHYELTSYHSEIDGANVEKLGHFGYDILRVSLDESEIEVEFTYRGEVELEITSDVVVRDSIDKDYMSLGSNKNTAMIQADFKGKAVISLDEDDGKVELLEVYDEEVIARDFDVPHEWESFVVYD